MSFDFATMAGETNATEVANYAKTGGIALPGKHHAVLDGVKPILSNKTGNTGEELTFLILAGESKGLTVQHAIWGSEKEGGKKIAMHYAHKLGLLRQNGARYEVVEGKSSFSDCIGAQCVIDTEVVPYTNSKGEAGKKAALKFNGIYGPNEPAVRGVPRGNVPERPAEDVNSIPI